MIVYLRRYFAIRSYLMRLSGELQRRFGERSFYTVEQVTQAVQRGGFSKIFIAHAQAAYCRQEDFDAQYPSGDIAHHYLDFRRTMARRYFSGESDFDARTIFNRLGRAKYVSGSFYESNIGINGTGGH
jgi:hypothetical protein